MRVVSLKMNSNVYPLKNTNSHYLLLDTTIIPLCNSKISLIFLWGLILETQPIFQFTWCKFSNLIKKSQYLTIMQFLIPKQRNVFSAAVKSNFNIPVVDKLCMCVLRIYWKSQVLQIVVLDHFHMYTYWTAIYVRFLKQMCVFYLMYYILHLIFEILL